MYMYMYVLEQWKAMQVKVFTQTLFHLITKHTWANLENMFICPSPTHHFLTGYVDSQNILFYFVKLIMHYFFLKFLYFISKIILRIKKGNTIFRVS